MITLLSDLGLQDPSVAIAKGILSRHAPGRPITDITHEIQPFNTRQAAYLLEAAYKSFPPGTCHIILFDIFAQPSVKVLVTKYDGQYFLSADNGLVATMLRGAPARTWLYEDVPGKNTFPAWLHAAGKAAYSLQAGKPEDLSAPGYSLRRDSSPEKKPNEDGAISIDVLHIDHFGNVVVDFRASDLPPGNNFRVRFAGMEEINEISVGYNDARQGYKLCRFNSHGYLELCISKGRAADIFGLRLGGKFNDIKIYL